MREIALADSLLQRRRDLRRSSTNAEHLLWRLLRSRKLAGAKFRRQHPFGPYILDFFCLEHRLVIEVDGGQHMQSSQAARDEARTRYLEAKGLHVLRFTNLNILQETEAVLEAIRQALDELAPSP